MSRILIVVGTRPNFIKVTRFLKVNEMMGQPFDIKIVHTGQHYDSKMAAIFFEQFELTPDFFLEVPAGSPNSQMAETMMRLEKVTASYRPDLMMVVGDVNSTLAAALTSNKMNIKLAHIESGLRSFDHTMPEEINRLLTDAITDYFFITEQSGYDNLISDGHDRSKLFMVGNTMIDTLVEFENKIQASKVLEEMSLEKGRFVLMTMHRPATVDSREGLERLVNIIKLITATDKLVFPIHPRTTNRLQSFGIWDDFSAGKNIVLAEPLDYFAFQKLVSCCAYVITDSGGIQEETTFRKVPCLTLRANTERPSTVMLGTNELVPFDLSKVEGKINEIKTGKYKKGTIPPLWDGHSTERILQACLEICSDKQLQKV